ncbi:hypothetical protein Sjap_010245 [Stephania japonica]|uniref:Uncharacterized protein n=1 Tax=Stephania japonica TaxID=461633 RepID=A0AAP0P412_9MAGN
MAGVADGNTEFRRASWHGDCSMARPVHLMGQVLSPTPDAPASRSSKRAVSASPTPSLTHHRSGGVSASPTPGVSKSLPHASRLTSHAASRRLQLPPSRLTSQAAPSRRLQLTASPTPSPAGPALSSRTSRTSTRSSLSSRTITLTAPFPTPSPMDSHHVTAGTLSTDASSTPMEFESGGPVVAPPNSSSLASSTKKTESKGTKNEIGTWNGVEAFSYLLNLFVLNF